MKNKNIKTIINDIMIACGYKEYRELARDLGVSRQVLSNWVRGTRNPSLLHRELLTRKYYKSVLKIEPNSFDCEQLDIDIGQYA